MAKHCTKILSFAFGANKTGLFLPVMKKTQNRKKIKANFSKKTQGNGVISIFQPKNSRFFHYHGPILIDLEAKIKIS